MEALSVAALLKRSRNHGANRTRLANQQQQGQPAPNYGAAEAEAAAALTLREQAHDLDPQHTDPEWANDPVPHAQLVEFYRRYAIPEPISTLRPGQPGSKFGTFGVQPSPDSPPLGPLR